MNLRIRSSAAVIFSLLILSSPAFAESPKHFLWKIMTPNNTVYLLGSIHVANVGLYPLSPVIENAYQDSQVLVVEADISKASGQAFQQSLQQLSTYGDGKTLRSQLPPELYAKLRDALMHIDINESAVSNLKPWSVGVTIMTRYLTKLGIHPRYGIDHHFLQQARNNKPILELESVEQQLMMLNGLTDKQQALFLHYTLLDLHNTEAIITDMLKAWKTGNTRAMEGFVFDVGEKQATMVEILDIMFDQRNRRMSEKILTYLGDDKNYFVVVGAGHLVGQQNILQLLQKQGYRAFQM